MFGLFGFLLFVSIVMFLISLFSPRVSLFFLPAATRNRPVAFAFYAFVMIVMCIGMGISSPDKVTDTTSTTVTATDTTTAPDDTDKKLQEEKDKKALEEKAAADKIAAEKAEQERVAQEKAAALKAPLNASEQQYMTDMSECVSMSAVGYNQMSEGLNNADAGSVVVGAAFMNVASDTAETILCPSDRLALFDSETRAGLNDNSLVGDNVVKYLDNPYNQTYLDNVTKYSESSKYHFTKATELLEELNKSISS